MWRFCRGKPIIDSKAKFVPERKKHLEALLVVVMDRPGSIVSEYKKNCAKENSVLLRSRLSELPVNA